MLKDVGGLFLGLLVGTVAGYLAGLAMGANHPLLTATIAASAGIVPLWIFKRKQRVRHD